MNLKSTILSSVLCFILILNVKQAYAQCNTYFTVIDAGELQSLGIKNDGTLWGWGSNWAGTIGDGTNINRGIPVQVGTATNWIAVSTGTYHSLGLTSDGKLWAWGLNNFGQVGDGTKVGKNTPIQVGNATNWTAISAGFTHSLALNSEGKIFAWGFNVLGQLGDGTTVDKTIPTQVGSATNWVKISANGNNSHAISSEGMLWAWGSNLYGHLGDGTKVSKSVPVQIGTGTNWRSVTGGAYHCFGITTDGKLWGWGDNQYGRLGDGTTVEKLSPVVIGNKTNWVKIESGSMHAVGLTSDGKMWSWGGNIYGQLGDGTLVNKTTPTQIGMDKNWANVTSGSSHSLGITSDNKTFAWGYNGTGEVGDGTLITKLIPVEINIAPGWALNSANSSVTTGQTNSTYYTNGCKLLARVQQNGATPVTGNVTAKVWIEGTIPTNFVRRHYEITPATQNSSTSGKVTLYFTQQEFNDFNGQKSGTDKLLPIGGDDLTGIANLRVEKRPGVSSDGTGLPASYGGLPVNIDPVDTDVVWNVAAERWEISFDVVGFSGFFVKAEAAPLPVNWISFDAKLNTEGFPILNWHVEEKNVSTYEVQKSVNGITFSTVGLLASRGNGNNKYSSTEGTALLNDTYYRIKQQDFDGSISYSRIVILKNREAENNITVYPVPARDFLIIELQNNPKQNYSVTLYNQRGQKVNTESLKKGVNHLNVTNLKSGMYILRTSLGESFKFTKE